MTGLQPVGDWDGDGLPDVVARTGSGELRLYRTNGAGTITGGQKIADGWNQIESFAGQNPDRAGSGLMAVDGSRKLWLYKFNGFEK